MPWLQLQLESLRADGRLAGDPEHTTRQTKLVVRSAVGRQHNILATPSRQCNTVDAWQETKDDPEPELSETVLCLCPALPCRDQICTLY